MTRAARSKKDSDRSGASEHGGCSRVFLRRQSGLVGYELRLNDEAHRPVQRLDLVQDRCGRTLDE